MVLTSDCCLSSRHRYPISQASCEPGAVHCCFFFSLPLRRSLFSRTAALHRCIACVVKPAFLKRIVGNVWGCVCIYFFVKF